MKSFDKRDFRTRDLTGNGPPGLKFAREKGDVLAIKQSAEAK
jgi:hypothetical protein